MGKVSRSECASRVGLSAEARRRQMVRGGRSCPSQWKAGAGAASAGNVTEAVSIGPSRLGGAVANGAALQPVAHTWQVPD